MTVTVTDDDGGIDTQSFFVTVSNVAPTGTLGNNGPVDEGSSATVTFTNQFDPSTADTTAGFRYAYDLDNDGTFDVGDGTYAGSVATDIADGLGGALGRRPRHADGAGLDHRQGRRPHRLHDQHHDQQRRARHCINIAVTDNTIDEGETATITMTIDDPGALDVFAVDVDWKDDAPADTITGLGRSTPAAPSAARRTQWDAQDPRAHGQPSLSGRQSDRHFERRVRGGPHGPRRRSRRERAVPGRRHGEQCAARCWSWPAIKSVDEGELLDLSGDGQPRRWRCSSTTAILDTHTATVDWGDGSATRSADDLFGQWLRRTRRDAHLHRQRRLHGDRHGDRRRRRHRHAAVPGHGRQRRPDGDARRTTARSTKDRSATVTFTNQFDPSTADTTAGFRYAYDLDNDGTFDVGDGTYAGSVGSEQPARFRRAARRRPGHAHGEGPHHRQGRRLHRLHDDDHHQQRRAGAGEHRGRRRHDRRRPDRRRSR